jgi:Zn finger protein HypA/HybF involved in hydrogenase expression
MKKILKKIKNIVKAYDEWVLSGPDMDVRVSEQAAIETAKAARRDNLIWCSHCLRVSDLEQWKAMREPCKTCGSHVFYICPICGGRERYFGTKEIEEKV